jgi:hypothetical protein
MKNNMTSKIFENWPSKGLIQSAEFWVRDITEHIQKIMEYIKNGWYEKNHSANATGYSVWAGDYMSRAYANCVLGQDRAALEEDLRTCLQYAVQSLDARDPRNPDYNEAHEKEYPYTESEVLEDIQYSLMAGDFELAKHFAGSPWAGRYFRKRLS